MINLELENSLSRQSFSNYPSDDKAVSFDKNGKVLSRFSDEYWDFSRYYVATAQNIKY